MIVRIYTEKKRGFDVEAKKLANELKELLLINSIKSVRILNRYDISIENDGGIDQFIYGVFAERNQDDVYYEMPGFSDNAVVFAVAYQQGQYDARSDAAEQCMKLIQPDIEVAVKHAKVYIIEGEIKDSELFELQKYMVNPVDSRLVPFDKAEAFDKRARIPEDEPVIDGFIDLNDDELRQIIGNFSLSIDTEDCKLIRDYFKNEEKRNPTRTEIKVLDTYWSDHCRHTTFLSHLNDIKFAGGEVNDAIKQSYESYKNARRELSRDELPVTLMDIATIAAKLNASRGLLDDLEDSDEVNACTYNAKVTVDGQKRDYLIMFKNETHNHPTEIEPFGGAATCIGGAIRDPLSARAYVYQSMRVTGCADPTQDIFKTIPGKLPQRKITTQAAAGFSSYGNQIGLCTGQVKEYYHEGFVAKRMEVGAVIATAPKENVVRQVPEAGDLVYIIGGRTGRDGIGGASGSSKSHNIKSVDTAGSEVQKGNAPEERKLQRLFRNPGCTRLIKRCNDFGAGGVSVAIGELAESLYIDLDSVLTKYDGLNATELAISESQERMAVVIAPENEEKFLEYVKSENIEYSKTALVTDSKRLIMVHRGAEVLNIKRSFINTNGAPKTADVMVNFDDANYRSRIGGKTFSEKFDDMALNLNTCSQKGMVEMFDNTIGACNLFMPYGGRLMRTYSDVMASLIPVIGGTSSTATVMAHGYDPYLAQTNPYLGGLTAVISAVNKMVCAGVDYKDIKLSCQEYFEKLLSDPLKWGKVFSALLGAFAAQEALGISAIGGKDSMSGTYEDLNVPPTLICFGAATADAEKLVTNVMESKGQKIYKLSPEKTPQGIVDLKDYTRMIDAVREAFAASDVLCASAVGFGGTAYAVANMCIGNELGFEFNRELSLEELFDPDYSSVLICVKDSADTDKLKKWISYVGQSAEEAVFTYQNDSVSVRDYADKLERKLQNVFPTASKNTLKAYAINDKKTFIPQKAFHIARPRVFIPVFPGTNCEYDTLKAFENAGAVCDVFVFKNLSASDIQQSAKEMAGRIGKAQIIALAGGFSAADEPDGSAKFIVSILNNAYVAQAVSELIDERGGLVIGICNGFQALVKTGLLPYGKLSRISENSPTLTYNDIGRHVAKLVHTRIASAASPWLAGTKAGDIHTVAVSHGEGRFVADNATIDGLIKNSQIAIQYCDIDGIVEATPEINPNLSAMNIEAITSPDGRILGKMGHSERAGKYIYKNVKGNFDQKIFESGVKYFL